MEELEKFQCADVDDRFTDCSGPVGPTFCPYAEEIDGISIPVILCEAHYEARCREI